MFKMEKRIQRQDSNLPFNRNVPGCFWSMFQTLDHHPWHNVKKMLPYRKHSRSKGGPKSTLNNHHVAEVPEQINNENKPQLCTAESCSFDRKYSEAHVNEVITKEMSEEESQNYWKLTTSNSKRKLIRTHSIHHIEPSYIPPEENDENGDSRVTPQQKTPMKLAASGLKCNSLNAMDTEDYFIQRRIAIRSTSFTIKPNGVKKSFKTNQINRNISSRSFKEDVHIQEIFKANRKLFAELLQGARGKDTIQTPQNMKSSARLAKAISFPAPGLARKGHKKITSLQHKQKESFPKGQKSVSIPQRSELVESESPENFHEDMTPCDSDRTSSHNIRQQTSSSSLGPNHGLKHGGWNQLVIKRFNFMKQKIRHSIRERKKGHNQKTSKGIPTADPSGHELPLYGEEKQESLGTATSEDGSGIRGNSETDSSENENLSNGVQTKTGTALLSASLERYSQLSEYGCDKNREAKYHNLPSLRLTSEDKISNRETPGKSFGRNLSMPIDLFCTLFTDPPRGVLRTEKPKRGLVHARTDNNVQTDENPSHLLNADISEPLDSESESMIEKGDDNMPVDYSDSLNGVKNDDNMPVDYSDSLNGVKNDEGTGWADELEEKIPHLDISDSKHHQVPGGECIVEDVRELSHIYQVSKLETCFQDDETSKLSNSEGAILNPGCSIANDFEPSDDEPNEASMEASPTFEIIVNDEIIDDGEKISNYLHLYPEPGTINNADFNYMRYILQLSSFIESGQPLNSLIFKGEEGHFYKKLECYWGKVDKDSDHQLLLDLVYATLHDVYETPLIFFLKTFSWRTQIRLMPLGRYLLEEVRVKVARYLCLGPELDQCLDDVVERDLRKGDDWMNLQSETEYVALELEDLILDELLDEVTSFRIFLRRSC